MYGARIGLSSAESASQPVSSAVTAAFKYGSTRPRSGDIRLPMEAPVQDDPGGILATAPFSARRAGMRCSGGAGNRSGRISSRTGANRREPFRATSRKRRRATKRDVRLRNWRSCQTPRLSRLAITQFCIGTVALATLSSMAEPTLKDVLQAIAKLDAKVDKRVDEVRSEVEDLRADVSVLSEDVTKLRDDVTKHRAETKKGFDDLDRELSGHARVHAQIEKDIETLKRRPPRTATRPTRPRAR
jgi:outer membrane murein-binding lipoprotein Lpp